MPVTSRAPAPVPVVSDAVLLAAIATGDERAFETLFHAHYNALCVFAERHVHSAHVAEELVEDVFCWIWAHRGELAIHGVEVRPYLYRAVRNRSLRWLAREQTASAAAVRSVAEAVPYGMGERATLPDDAVQQDEFTRAVARAIGELPPKCQEVFVLARQHGMTHAQVGAMLGISPNTVENHIARALKLLRMSLAAWRR